MFAATDTPASPWHVVDSNDKRRARLNCIAHLLSLVPYEEVPREPVKFPKRQAKGDYVEPDYPFRWIPAGILKGRRETHHGRTAGAQPKWYA